MNSKDKFAVFILTYGRPEKVKTIDSLRKGGYTGKIYLICSTDDKELERYQKLHENVIVFNKQDSFLINAFVFFVIKLIVS